MFSLLVLLLLLFWLFFFKKKEIRKIRLILCQNFGLTWKHTSNSLSLSLSFFVSHNFNHWNAMSIFIFLKFKIFIIYFNYNFDLRKFSIQRWKQCVNRKWLKSPFLMYRRKWTHSHTLQCVCVYACLSVRQPVYVYPYLCECAWVRACVWVHDDKNTKIQQSCQQPQIGLQMALLSTHRFQCFEPNSYTSQTDP